MTKNCKQCGSAFEVTQDDLTFYDQVSPTFGGKKILIPSPTLCPDCRVQKRYAFRNERKLYRRACAKTGASVVSIYHPESPHVIYSADAWWSDDWDPLSFGQDIDWNRPFFDQFTDLYRAVPHLALINVKNENCDYANQCGWSKNCYMAFSTDFSEDCYYTYCCFGCKNCIDSTGLHDCELCYDCVDNVRCYACLSCRDCSACTDCTLCSDCKGCKNCFGCAGLRNKEYCIFNEQVSEEQWKAFMAKLDHTQASFDRYRVQAEQVRLRVPHPHVVMINCTGCTGDYLTNSKNAIACFDGKNTEDCKYSTLIPSSAKNSQDMSGGVGELLYQTISTGPGYLCRFVIHCWNDVSDLYYCVFCMNGSKDLFGCVGLRKAQYCILNKQYSKEEYQALVPKLIMHMQKTGEWGEFFPSSISPFGYNETVAQDYFPLSEKQAREQGFLWRDARREMPAVKKIIPAAQLPATIDQIPDEILEWAIECTVTKRPFRIVKQELEYYRKMKLPMPRLHPDERYQRRMALRNPRKLWDRECAKCGEAITTSYAPDRPEIVYCEECYLATVY